MEPTSSESLPPDDVSHQIEHRSHQQLIFPMELSIESAVAGAVAVAFAVFSMVAVLQEHGERGTGSVTGYSPTTSAALNYASLR
jgi:hypothetical protein